VGADTFLGARVWWCHASRVTRSLAATAAPSITLDWFRRGWERGRSRRTTMNVSSMTTTLPPPTKKRRLSKYRRSLEADTRQHDEWRAHALPLDVSHRPLVLLTPCGDYVFAVVGCKPPDHIQRHERLFYKCVACPPAETLRLQGPNCEPCDWFVYDNPTHLLQRTQRYKGNGFTWEALKVYGVRLSRPPAVGGASEEELADDGGLVDEPVYRQLALKFLSSRWDGPGFVASSAERVEHLLRLRDWTKNYCHGVCFVPSVRLREAVPSPTSDAATTHSGG
jgi:hypothetical protein